MFRKFDNMTEEEQRDHLFKVKSFLHLSGLVMMSIGSAMVFGFGGFCMALGLWVTIATIE